MLLIKSILLSFSLLPMPWAELDFSYLDYNSCFYEAASKSFFQVIYCDVDTNQVLEITNRTSQAQPCVLKMIVKVLLVIVLTNLTVIIVEQ